MLLDIPKQLSEELNANEKLLWIGNPNPFQYALHRSIFKVSFGLMVIGIAVSNFFKEEKLPSLNSINFQTAISILFILIGLNMALSPLWRFLEARSLIFFITNKRAGKLFLFPRRRVWSLLKKDYGPIETQQLGGGFGSIFFNVKAITDSDGTSYQKQGFVGIKDVREVERILNTATEPEN